MTVVECNRLVKFVICFGQSQVLYLGRVRGWPDGVICSLQYSRTGRQDLQIRTAYIYAHMPDTQLLITELL